MRIGYANGGFDIKAMKESSTRYEEFDPAGVEQIFVSETSDDVIFKPSEDGLIHIEYRETKNVTHTSSLENGKLTVRRLKTSPDTFRFWLTDLFSVIDGRVIVFIPEGLSCSVECKGSSGDIALSALSFTDLSVSLSSGDIKVENCSAGAAVISGTSGDIRISGLTVDGDISVSLTSGEISGSDIICGGSASLKTTSGDIDLASFAAEKAFSCKVSSGDIEIASLASPDIMAKASSGDIKLTVLGDEKEYRVSAEASSGDVDSPRSSKGNKSIDVKTSSGDIKVEFIG
ncbi:MAG: DUF4097 family beta strand repeat protein [Oscillospiraceae bacterium]|nr:DUF4097 family beta strand repeat protein [Oscillospiraceae bacterium]